MKRWHMKPQYYVIVAVIAFLIAAINFSGFVFRGNVVGRIVGGVLWGIVGIACSSRYYSARLKVREREVHDLRETLLARTHDAAVQQERNRLARELHDSIKQQIFSISMSAAAAEARWEADPQGARVALGDVRRSAREAMAEMNALLQQLSPAPLEKVGLVQALRDQCEALGYRTGAQVTVEFGALPADDRLPTGAQESVFRIVQEAFSNVARHARAERVRLYVGQRDADGPLIVEVRDDGQGFEVDTAEGGMGLENIHQRVLTLGGDLAVESVPDEGTTLCISIPLVKSIIGDLSMYKQDHTLNKIFLVGVGGGLALIAALLYPLYVLVPGGLVGGWSAGSGVIGLALEIVAVLVAVAIGFLAARWGRADTRQGGVLFGALAGGVAGTILYFGIGAAAAGVMGSDLLLTHGLAPVIENADMVRATVFESLAGITWWSHGAFWAALLAGVGLGAIGGLLTPPAAESFEQLHQRLAVTPVLIASFLFSALFTLVISVSYFSWMETFVRTGRFEQVISGELVSTLADILADVSFWCVSTPMILYLASLIALYFSLRTEAETQDPARLNRAFMGGATLGLVSLGTPIYILLVNPDLIRLASMADVIAAVTVTGSLVLGGLYLAMFFQVRQQRRALGIARSHPVQTVATISALLSLGMVGWATTLPPASSVPIGLTIIIANVALAVFVEVRRQRVPDADYSHIVQTAAVVGVLLGLITTSWAISLSSLATILVGLTIIVANGVLIVILRRQPRRALLDTIALSRLRLVVSQSISAGLGVAVAMLVPLMANLGTAVSIVMIPARWKTVSDGLDYTLIELVRGAYLAQARVFVVSFVVLIALIGLQTLFFSGIMTIVRQRA